MKEIIKQLQDHYQTNPVIRGLIQVIPGAGVPDALLSTFLTNLKAKKLKTFYQQLSQGKLLLTTEIIAKDDFLNPYFSILEYVLRNRSDLKFCAFAEILRSFCNGEISLDEQEDYTKIFDDLTEREFFILSVKYNYELQYKDQELENPLKRAFLYWEEFKTNCISKLKITDQELNAMLIRIQRTGCYIKFTGYFDMSHDQVGETSELFKKLKQIICLSDDR